MPHRFDASQLLVLHHRLCDGDRTASEELALEALVEGIARQFLRSDEQMLYEAVTEAVLDYCARPCQFDEERGMALHLSLLMTSRRNMLNLLRGEARRKAREEEAGNLYADATVELDPVVGNLLQKEENEKLHRQQEDMMSLLDDPKDR